MSKRQRGDPALAEFTFQQDQLVNTGPAHMVADASTMRFTPGEFPILVAVVDLSGDPILFRRTGRLVPTDYECAGFVYRCVDSVGRTLTILND